MRRPDSVSPAADCLPSLSLRGPSEPSLLLLQNSGACSYPMIMSLENGPFKKLFLTLCPLLLCPVQAENKGDNDPDEGDKAQDCDNEKASEKEQDSEVSEDTKSGNVRKLFILHCVKL